MSENLSIDEIIKKAEKIKAEAEKELLAAEKRLDEKAKEAVNEVTVDEEEIEEIVSFTAAGDEDVKEFRPAQKSEEIIIEDVAPDSKTRSIVLEASDKTMDVEDFGKTKISKAIKLANEKTKRVSFVSTNEDEHGGLEKIPTIVAHDTIKGFNEEEKVEEESIQIKFAGFDDKIESVPEIDEEVAERELEKRRKEKVGKFRLFGPEETDEELGDSSLAADDFEEDDEKDAFVQGLISKKNSIWIKIVATLILGIPLLLMTVFRDSASLPGFLASHGAYFGTATALFSIICIVNLNVFTHGFKIKKPFNLNFDFYISVVSILILIHTLALAISESLWIDNGVLLASAGTLALFMSQLGKHNMMTRIIDNFEFITSLDSKYTVENITNTVDADIISRGLVENEGKLKISVNCDFPTNFLEISCKNEPSDRLSKRIMTVNFVLSLILFIVIGIKDNFNTGFNMALCAMAMATPLSALFLTNSILSDISSQLSSYNSRVCGYEGSRIVSDTNAIVMEAADLFDKNSCDLHGIKTFGGAKVDDAIINAAAVMVQTKSPLAHVFDDVIIGQQSILPRVESIVYEESLGTSAWIYKRKVLIGTRELLKLHGVSVPLESFEQKYTIKDRKALYLAVGGEIMAMFIVSYNADPDLKRELKKLEKRDVTVIVKSTDPYINEKSLATLFGVPDGFIRVMNYSASRVYDKYSHLSVEKSPAYIVHNGTALGFVSAMRGAAIIKSAKDLVNFLLFFGTALGFIAIALFSVMGAYTQISTLSIILFHLIWTLFSFVISKMRSIGI
ncbi:MAG: hypothetical protein IJT65_03630 [Eubacterium sp.]|nr:hypothetical protein [Eubacterium sp.]